jgi:hypothetical protein
MKLDFSIMVGGDVSMRGFFGYLFPCFCGSSDFGVFRILQMLYQLKLLLDKRMGSQCRSVENEFQNGWSHSACIWIQRVAILSWEVSWS